MKRRDERARSTRKDFDLQPSYDSEAFEVVEVLFLSRKVDLTGYLLIETRPLRRYSVLVKTERPSQ